jgi:cation:H+ antiporter
MFTSLGLAVLLAIFAGAAAIIWVAGVKLADTTDILSRRLGLGEALGGVILLAIATNLPEIAIVVSAAVAGDVGVAVGNILGGIAIQTLVLAAMDAFGMKEKVPLTYKAASLTLVIEGLLVVAVLIVAVMGTQLPPSAIYMRVAPDALIILILWIIGVWLVGRANAGLPWHDQTGSAPDTQSAPKGHAKIQKEAMATRRGHGTALVAAVFGLAAIATLVSGVLLERAGNAIAGHIGMSGVLFGATVLAAATSLPELSTGIRSTRSGDYQLAISDIFGGNAFLPVLFLLATVVSGRAVLPQAGHTDIYLAGLGVLLTSVYLAGLIFRPRSLILGMGIDSVAVLILYAIGTAGLFLVAAR